MTFISWTSDLPYILMSIVYWFFFFFFVFLFVSFFFFWGGGGGGGGWGGFLFLFCFLFVCLFSGVGVGVGGGGAGFQAFYKFAQCIEIKVKKYLQDNISFAVVIGKAKNFFNICCNTFLEMCFIISLQLV